MNGGFAHFLLCQNRGARAPATASLCVTLPLCLNVPITATVAHSECLFTFTPGFTSPRLLILSISVFLSEVIFLPSEVLILERLSFKPVVMNSQHFCWNVFISEAYVPQYRLLSCVSLFIPACWNCHPTVSGCLFWWGLSSPRYFLLLWWQHIIFLQSLLKFSFSFSTVFPRRVKVWFPLYLSRLVLAELSKSVDWCFSFVLECS